MAAASEIWEFHYSTYVPIILLEIGEKTLLFTCAQDGEQQAVMEVKFWPEKFQGGGIHTFEWGKFFNFALKFRLVNEFCHSTKN